MNTTRLKSFAAEARNTLKRGVMNRILALGFDKQGKAVQQPQKFEGGAVFMGETVSEDFFNKWQALRLRIITKGLREVQEEAAYTWFNRLMAIRIMQKNGLIDPVLDYRSESVRLPILLTNAQAGNFPTMPEADRDRLRELLNDPMRTAEQFAILITAFCHNTPVINRCFGKIADYTELLLPNDILEENGFLDSLNNTPFIDEDDYKSPELIGWLYQFYISERKDEVMAKTTKYVPDEIPAATQIFTPNWIVKYMVQNTVGRIYLDNNPYEDELKAKWKYLVENDQQGEKLEITDLTELKVGDLACGSGHILNECFDLLLDLYVNDGYNRREAIENIFKYNLTGIDIDTRAKQLATFALLLKACQKDVSFKDAHIMPRVLDMPENLPFTVIKLGTIQTSPTEDPDGWYKEYLSLLDGAIQEYLVTSSTDRIIEVRNALLVFNNCDSLGSIMKFDISDSTRFAIDKITAEWKEKCESGEKLPTKVKLMLPYFDVLLTLSQKYASLIANPPYMGRKKMEKALCDYVDEHYSKGKQDLFAVFMEMMIDKTIKSGRTAFITMESWMFLSSFEAFRRHIIDNVYIQSLGHFGWHIIGIAFGTAMTVIQNAKANGKKGTYSYLTIEDLDADKNVPYTYPKKDNGRFAIISQNDFKKITGSPIGYWVSDAVRETFTRNRALSAVCKPTQGLATADNARFLRSWFEVDSNRIYFGCPNAASAAQNFFKKWFPYNKGGQFRKWYGNQDYVVNWQNDGEEIRAYKGSVVRNPTTYFKPSLSWSKVTAGNIAFRAFPSGFIYDVAGTSLFPYDDNKRLFYLGAVNSNSIRHILKVISPTLNFEVGQIATLPIPEVNAPQIDKLVDNNIHICKGDWDAHETSWDFQRNELLEMQSWCGGNVADLDMLDPEEAEELSTSCPTNAHLIEHCVWAYHNKWERNFHRLHNNEEELNRQFINIYGLQDELTPDVPLDEVTILQQGEISIENNEIVWHDDALMKQLISYAVGCWMGRYRLDKPGLHIAHTDATSEEIAPYEYNNEQFVIDDDGIIPLMSKDCMFSDNAELRMADFVRHVFGELTQVENLNFIEECLGKTLEQYFIKDFWKDHKKMYQNRPIYWLFSSKKGAFQCLVYMHRMDKYTAERVRQKYLLPHMEDLRKRIADMEQRAASLNTQERKKLDTLRKDLAECEEYHDRLHPVADRQIDFDLDDGVVVNYAKFGDILAKIK